MHSDRGSSDDGEMTSTPQPSSLAPLPLWEAFLVPHPPGRTKAYRWTITEDASPCPHPPPWLSVSPER